MRYWILAALMTMVAGASEAQQITRDEGEASAHAELKDAQGRVMGHARVSETPNGTLWTVALDRVPSGVRGLHIHERGRCEPPAFDSAGGHFNPSKVQHGFDVAGGPHIGDLPNVHVPASGSVTVELFVPDLRLRTGNAPLLDSDGAALVLHARADDYQSEPAGSSGDRLACGVIQGL